MSLLCTETSKSIMYGTPLYCGAPRKVDSFCALSQEAVDRIPENERRVTPCATEHDGVDIYEGTSTKNFNDTYSWSGLQLGKFLFSVSVQTAERCIPKLWAEYQPGHQQRPASINVTIEVLDIPPGKPN